MVLLTATNLLSTRSYGEFEFWFASIKVAAIVAFILVAGSYALGFTSPTGATLGNLVAHGGFAPFGGGAVLAGVTGIVFSMTGAEIVTVVAAESSEPSRAIATMTTSLILRILLFYVGAVFCILAVVPWNEIAPGIVAVRAGARAHADSVRGDDHEPDRARGRVVVPELGTLCHVANVVRPRRERRCAALDGRARLSRRADARDPDRQCVRLPRGDRIGRFAAAAVYVSRERVGRDHARHLFARRARADPTAPRALERESPRRLVIRMWLFPWLSYAAVAGIVLVLASMLFRDAERTQLGASALSVAVVLCAFWWRRRRAQPLRSVKRDAAGMRPQRPLAAPRGRSHGAALSRPQPAVRS